MKLTYRKINILLAGFIILWLNAGNFDYVASFIPSIVKFAFVLLWFIIAIKTVPKFISEYVHVAFPIFIIIGLLSFARVLGRVDYFEQYFMIFLYIAIQMGMFVYYYYHGNKQELRTIIFIFLADVIIVSVHTYVELLNNPALVRAVSTGVEQKAILLGNQRIKGVGGYSWCYQLVFFTMCIAYYFNEYKKKTLIKYAIYVMIFLILFQAQITIALLMFVFCVLILEFVRSHKSFGTVMFKILVSFAIVYLIVNFSSIVQFAVTHANEELANRLSELLNLGSNYSTESDLGVRMQKYKESIDTFLGNIVWGSFGQKPYGGHSTFLDLFAVFGIFGLVGVKGLLNPILILFKDYYENKIVKGYISLILFIFILLSIVNVSIDSNISLVLYLIIPLFFKLINLKKSEFYIEGMEMDESSSD